tara:strand:- start:666 stop:1022 length:357 start_codon:yes stop_codon:yes gene_type:complete
MNKDSFQFKVPIYGVLVKVIKAQTKDMRTVFKDSTGIDRYNIMNPMEFAKTIQLDNKHEGSYVVLLLTENYNTSILVHESVHMAKAVMRISGVKLLDEETEAYITQYCFSVVDSFFSK